MSSPRRTTRQYGPALNRKLTISQAIEIRRRVAAGQSQRSLASEYEVSKGTVSGIVAGELYPDAIRKRAPFTQSSAARYLAGLPERRSSLDLSYDPDVQRCRMERERRPARNAQLMDEAKLQFAAVMEAAKVVGRGGRPRGIGSRYDFSNLRNDDA